MAELPQLTEAEFEHIEETIARTAKGRAFLRRYQRRAGGAAEGELRCLLEELRGQWQQQLKTFKDVQTSDVLRRELVQMADSIEQARREVAALRPPAQARDKILTATNELDAIVSTTERASIDIITSAERLLQVVVKFKEGGSSEELCNEIENEVTAIFTACSFQDLTGQRTKKVIGVIRYLEQRINAMISLWEPSEGEDSEAADPLLHGPAFEGEGVTQSEVDRLFGEDAVTALSSVLDAVAVVSPAAEPAIAAPISGTLGAEADGAEQRTDGPQGPAGMEADRPAQSKTDQPVEHQPVEHQSVEHQPVEHQPTGNKLSEDQPSEDLSAEDLSAEKRSPDRPPVDDRPVASKPPAGPKAEPRREQPSKTGPAAASESARRKPKPKRKEPGADAPRDGEAGGGSTLDQSSIDALFD